MSTSCSMILIIVDKESSNLYAACTTKSIFILASIFIIFQGISWKCFFLFPLTMC